MRPAGMHTCISNWTYKPVVGLAQSVNSLFIYVTQYENTDGMSSVYFGFCVCLLLEIYSFSYPTGIETQPVPDLAQLP